MADGANNIGATISSTAAIAFNASKYYAVGNSCGGLFGTVTIPGPYPTLTGVGGLFAAINTANALCGNLTVIISGNISEPGTNTLSQWATGTNYSITIQPDGIVQRVVSGTVATNPMIHIEARRVTINGNYQGSGMYLIIC